MGKAKLVKNIMVRVEKLNFFCAHYKWLVFWLLYPEINALVIEAVADEEVPGYPDYYLHRISFRPGTDMNKFCKRLGIELKHIFTSDGPPRNKRRRNRRYYDLNYLSAVLKLTHLPLEEAMTMRRYNPQAHYPAQRLTWIIRPKNVVGELIEIRETILTLSSNLDGEVDEQDQSN